MVPAMPSETPVARVASLLLGRPVLDYIDDRREAGVTWQAIADELADLTNGEVVVTWQAIQGWARRAPAA